MSSPKTDRAASSNSSTAGTRVGFLFLLVVTTPVFMTLFDYSSITVAGPTIFAHTDASAVGATLIIAGYGFTYASGLVLGGNLGDRFGRRRLFQVGVFLFGVTSLLCALSASQYELIAARLCQGAAAALVSPQVLALIKITLPPERHAGALAMFGVVNGLGTVAGQALGGWIVDLDVAGTGWRAIFLVNIPICLTIFIAARFVIPRDTVKGSNALDLLGAAGVSLTAMAVLAPIVFLSNGGVQPWMLFSLLGAAVVGSATGRYERRRERKSQSLAFDFSLIRNREFAWGVISIALYMTYFAGFLFCLTLYLQNGAGLDAASAGLIFAPQALAFSIGAFLGKSLHARYGDKVVTIGIVLTLTGISMVGIIVAIGWPPMALSAGLIVCGLGNGLAVPLLMNLSLNKSIPDEKAGAASGLLTTAQQFSNPLGTAGLSVIFFSLDRYVNFDAAMIGIAVVSALLVLGALTSASKLIHSPR